MIAPIDLANIESVAKLLQQYDLEEYASEHFTLKRKSRPNSRPIPVESIDLLAKHLEPLPNEPWDSVDPAVANAWAERGAP